MYGIVNQSCPSADSPESSTPSMGVASDGRQLRPVPPALPQYRQLTVSAPTGAVRMMCCAMIGMKR